MIVRWLIRRRRPPALVIPPEVVVPPTVAVPVQSDVVVAAPPIAPPPPVPPPPHAPVKPPVDDDLLPPSGPSLPPPAPYRLSIEHLEDELRRVERLLQAELIRQRAAARDDVVARPFSWDGSPDEPSAAAVRSRLASAAAWEEYIVERLRLTSALRSNQRPLRVHWLAIACKLASYDGPRNPLALDVLLLAVLTDRVPRYRAADAFSAGGLTAEAALRTVSARSSAPGEDVPLADVAVLPWHLLTPSAPLLEHALIDLGPADHPARQSVRPDPRAADFLLDGDTTDPVLADAVHVLPANTAVFPLGLDDEARGRLERLADSYCQTPAPQRLTVLLHGPYGTPAVDAAHAFAARLGRSLLVADPTRVPAGLDWQGFVRRVYREARFGSRLVCWEASETVLADPPRWDVLIASAEAAALPTVIASEVSWEPSRAFRKRGHYFVRVESPAPTAEVRERVWKARLGDGTSADELEQLAAFQFTEGQIDDALTTARGLTLAADAERVDDPLFEACRRQSARRLVSFATRIRPRIDPSDRGRPAKDVLAKRVVLPDRPRVQLAELYDRMWNLGRVHRRLGFGPRHGTAGGLVALFAGDSGTGKTHAAVTLAGLLGTDVYAVDLAAVTSKWVGETEKNLGRVFADAQDANAVLFFDEADSLFGKRGAVDSAQDRWANLEVNYLLQRVEQYAGTVILATNQRASIDPAFVRRVQVLIDFPKPDAAARRNILAGLFEDTTLPMPDRETVFGPVADGFKDLTGGNLRNVAVDAVFRALADTPIGRPPAVTLEHLVLAAAREYQKLGLPVGGSTFGREWAELANNKLKLGLK